MMTPEQAKEKARQTIAWWPLDMELLVRTYEKQLRAERQRGEKLAAAVNQWLNVDRDQGGCDQLSLARAVQAYEEASHA